MLIEMGNTDYSVILHETVYYKTGGRFFCLERVVHPFTEEEYL